MSSQRDPFTEPFAKPEDLGLAIPDSDHAVSVCLPTWKDVIGYEEGEDRVLDELELGYPRFVEHPFVAELFFAAAEEFAKKDEVALVFPSLAAAWRCADFAKRNGAKSARMESYGWYDLTVLLVKEDDYPIAWKGWQHVGEIVSSRMAEAALLDAPLPDDLLEKGTQAASDLRSRIADLYDGVTPEQVYLFSSGMAAISAVHRIVTAEWSGIPTIQLEFPYLDALKLQQKCNSAGVIDFSIVGENGGFQQVADYFTKGENAAALFSEIPSNPLLRTGNLKEIANLLEQNEVPLILDDTVATAHNVDGFLYADVITTSLTKLFSGEGDVAAGAVILKPSSKFYKLFSERLQEEEKASPLFSLDAIMLELNSRHFKERVAATNDNALEVLDYLEQHPKVGKLWHPSMTQRDYYEQVRQDDGGYGALFSMQLKAGDPIKFYDQLAISKGPSLGTNFSLVCPYTLLAHYDELEWAEKCGVPKDLIRVWIGLEDPEDLIERFDRALADC